MNPAAKVMNPIARTLDFQIEIKYNNKNHYWLVMVFIVCSICQSTVVKTTKLLVVIFSFINFVKWLFYQRWVCFYTWNSPFMPVALKIAWLLCWYFSSSSIFWKIFKNIFYRKLPMLLYLPLKYFPHLNLNNSNK